MIDNDEPPEYEVGYRKAPASNRFRKGESGNARGRPRGRRVEPPYEAVLGQMVTIREDGAERQVTAAAAFVLYMTKRGLEGDGAAARAAMVAIEEARAARPTDGHAVTGITTVFVTPGSVSLALELLRMGVKLDRYRQTARMALEPWLVEAALARLGDRQLTAEQQDIVVRATRTPAKVKWNR